mmetsp:Transcript_484/g.1453  ORF Transcript_484/g.1453 Transcript_484/m.1453 type:complete len:329 (-) Transcript_484:18-1004(-)
MRHRDFSSPSGWLRRWIGRLPKRPWHQSLPPRAHVPERTFDTPDQMVDPPRTAPPPPRPPSAGHQTDPSRGAQRRRHRHRMASTSVLPPFPASNHFPLQHSPNITPQPPVSSPSWCASPLRSWPGTLPGHPLLPTGRAWTFPPMPLSSGRAAGLSSNDRRRSRGRSCPPGLSRRLFPGCRRLSPPPPRRVVRDRRRRHRRQPHVSDRRDRTARPLIRGGTGIARRGTRPRLGGLSCSEKRQGRPGRTPHSRRRGSDSDVAVFRLRHRHSRHRRRSRRCIALPLEGTNGTPPRAEIGERAATEGDLRLPAMFLASVAGDGRDGCRYCPM